MGIDPPAYSLQKEPIYPDKSEYPPCKKCGKAHGMGVEDTSTGIVTPLDICKECMFKNIFKWKG